MMFRVFITIFALLALSSAALADPDSERDTANAISKSLVATIDRDTAAALWLPGVGDVVRMTKRALLVSLGASASDAKKLKLAAQLLDLGGNTYWQISQNAVLPTDVSARIWRRVASTLDSAATYAESTGNLGLAATLASAESVAKGLEEVSKLAAKSGRKIAEVAKDLTSGVNNTAQYLLQFLDY